MSVFVTALRRRLPARRPPLVGPGRLGAMATLIVLAVVAAASAFAQGVSAADTIKARQHDLKALGSSFKVIRDELKSGAPDAGKVKTAAAEIAKAGNAIEQWFPPGTGPEAGVKTDAKAEIWSDAAGFATAREAFVRAAAKSAQQLTDSGNSSTWSAAAETLGQTCKGCHDKYRVKRD